MSKSQKTWLIVTAVFQMLTFLMHSLSLVATPEPANDAEKQMLELMFTYRINMGAGFHPTMFNILTSFSICFSLLLLLGGLLCILLVRHKATGPLPQSIMAAQTVIFLACFVAMMVFTFMIPVVCVGLITASCITSWWTYKMAPNP